MRKTDREIGKKVEDKVRKMEDTFEKSKLTIKNT